RKEQTFAAGPCTASHPQLQCSYRVTGRMPVEWPRPSARATENDDEQVDATTGRNPDADHRVAAGAADACLVRGTIREGATASRPPRVLRRAQSISARESAGGRQVRRIVRRHGA